MPINTSLQPKESEDSEESRCLMEAAAKGVSVGLVVGAEFVHQRMYMFLVRKRRNVCEIFTLVAVNSCHNFKLKGFMHMIRPPVGLIVGVGVGCCVGSFVGFFVGTRVGCFVGDLVHIHAKPSNL